MLSPAQDPKLKLKLTDFNHPTRHVFCRTATAALARLRTQLVHETARLQHDVDALAQTQAELDALTAEHDACMARVADAQAALDAV